MIRTDDEMIAELRRVLLGFENDEDIEEREEYCKETEELLEELLEAFLETLEMYPNETVYEVQLPSDYCEVIFKDATIMDTTIVDGVALTSAYTIISIYRDFDIETETAFDPINETSVMGMIPLN